MRALPRTPPPSGAPPAAAVAIPELPRAEPGTSLYVHLPFCATKCRYCDFPSYPGKGMPIDAYLDALCVEIRARAPRHPRTIFLGGGTPTYLGEAQIRRVFSTIAEATGFEAGRTEVTVEANPESATEEKLLLLRRSGANRLSLGVQAMRERLLQFFDRPHDVGSVRRAVAAARAAGFENLNLDLIFGAPGQTPADWREDLSAAIALQPDHLSLYDLVYEEGTAFRRWLDRGWLSPLPEEVCRELFLISVELAGSSGFRPYEVSNFARPGRECRHNLTYWRNEPYVGVGCGAASYVGGIRWKNDARVLPYIRALERGAVPLIEQERLAGLDRLKESIFLGLRLREGVTRSRLLRETGLDLETVFDLEIRTSREKGLLEWDGERLFLTEEGVLLADSVLYSFFTQSPV
ncbi:MAG: radical SAM family heme chaperone HemW [Planctomycetes bacterium]|nr:radical SAM family heme chaperone HemW [Planctomycetota bacterium]